MSNKEDPVTKDQTKIMGMIAILVVSFLIIISVHGVWVDPEPLEHPDPWYVYIVRFQTLIGGLLAVGAAFITIRQMRKTDEAAERRHTEFFELQNRPIVTAINKIVFRHVGTIRGSRVSLSAWMEVAPDMSQIADKESMVDTIEGMKAEYEAIGEIFEDKDWEACLPYLGVECQSAVFDMRKNLPKSNRMLDRHIKLANEDPDGFRIKYLGGVFLVDGDLIERNLQIIEDELLKNSFAKHFPW